VDVLRKRGRGDTYKLTLYSYHIADACHRYCLYLDLSLFVEHHSRGRSLALKSILPFARLVLKPTIDQSDEEFEYTGSTISLTYLATLHCLDFLWGRRRVRAYVVETADFRRRLQST